MLNFNACIFVLCYFACGDFQSGMPRCETSPFKPKRGETLVRSTQTCFPSTHSKTKMTTDLSVNLPSSGYIKKFTDAFFFMEIQAHSLTNIKKNIVNYIMPVFENRWLSIMKRYLFWKIYFQN